MIDTTCVNSIDILLIEHNFDSSYKTLEFFKEKIVINRIHTVRDGIEAVDFIRHEGIFSSNFHSCLVMIDLKVPYCREVFIEIIKNKRLKNLPVIIFSDLDEDYLLKSVSLPQNHFVVKPADLQKSFDIITSGEKINFSFPFSENFAEKKHSYLM